MSALLILPVIKDQTAFNLDRWDELCADKQLAKWAWRFETDRFGRVIATDPAEFRHGMRLASISFRISELLDNGQSVVVCPVSTREGVKVVDAAWTSRARLAKIG